MEIVDLEQGTPEWHAHRAAHANASDTPAMMGISPYMTRRELLHILHTGIAPEVDQDTQRRFADGHRFEALARPLAEKIIGEDLAPLVGKSGKFSASFDGLSMMGDIAFEHKTLNEALSYTPWDEGNGWHLPERYQVQMEHQLMVSGASRVLFMASKWHGDSLVQERHCWYASDPKLRQRIIDGWAQFEKDLANYEPPANTKPSPTGTAPEMLPALRIEVTGAVTASNLADFKAHASQVFQGIKTDLQNDADFADAEKTTKWCKEVETRLDAAKQHALSQTVSIDELFRTIDAIKEEARQKRLTLEKMVKQRKDAIRVERVEAARADFADHVAGLQGEIIGVHLDVPQPDFGGAIKGLKSIDSIQNALDSALAQAKIDADAKAKDLRAKLTWCKEHSAGHAALFPDLAHLVNKPMDDFQLAITSRIDTHQKAEAEKLEVERERIRQEEAAKLSAEPALPPAVPEPAAKEEPPQIDAKRDRPSLKLSEINSRLGFTVTADFLQSIGFAPHIEGRSKLYHNTDFARLCGAISNHVQSVAEQLESINQS